MCKVVVMSFRSGWALMVGISISDLSKKAVTFLSRSFITLKGVTAPGFTPSRSIRASGEPNESVPFAPITDRSFLRSISLF